MKPRVLHISADVPDEFAPQKTRAVANLVDIAHGLDHHIFSINRRSPAIGELLAGIAVQPARPDWPITSLRGQSGLDSLAYVAPPKGLYLTGPLERMADRIAEETVRQSIYPDIVHAHKLTIEGLVAGRVSRLLGIPYALTSMGNTDARIIALRPDLRARFRGIYRGASILFAYSPWMLALLEQRLGPRGGPSHVLPVPTPADRIISPVATGPALVSALDLACHRNKNARGLVDALALAVRERPDIRLAICGARSRAVESRLARWAGGAAKAALCFEGPVAHAGIQSRFNRAAGFVLASKRESFGMVFVEALLGGCPVAYPRGRAIAGLFDDHDFVIPVDPHDVESIADAMLRLVRDQSRLKQALASWQQTPHARALQRDAIAALYEATIRNALGVAEAAQ